MPTGYGSAQVNSQLVPMRTADAYSPRPWGPTMMVAPSSVNTVPPMLAQGGLPAAVGSRAGVPGGGAEGQLAAAGMARPFDWAHSPIPIVLFGLVVTVLWLRGVHWGGGS